jgi:hypothetical protein
VICLNFQRSTNNITKIQQYLQNSRQYYDNSHDLITQKELAKAGELLWGAIAEATKALHLIVKNKPVDIHTDITKYLGQLAVQYGDTGKIKMEHVSAARQLHTNFYESDLVQQGESTFFEQYEYGRILFGFLMDLIERYPGITQ